MRGKEYCESTLKRSLDISIASGLLPMTSPLWLYMLIHNYVRKERLIFYDKRVGVGGKYFYVLKFETLFTGAENDPLNEQCWHISGREQSDPRTMDGAMGFLRQTGLNEVPQIVNILSGEMSVVGPRPLPQGYHDIAVSLFPQIYSDWRAIALSVKPGLVGVSPIHIGRVSVEDFPNRAKMDIEYVEQATIWRDLRVISQAAVFAAK